VKIIKNSLYMALWLLINRMKFLSELFFFALVIDTNKFLNIRDRNDLKFLLSFLWWEMWHSRITRSRLQHVYSCRQLHWSSVLSRSDHVCRKFSQRMFSGALFMYIGNALAMHSLFKILFQLTVIFFEECIYFSIFPNFVRIQLKTCITYISFFYDRIN